MRAGALDDPFVDDNETTSAWLGRTDREYPRDLSWIGPSHERVDLVFEGLDTVAMTLVGDREVSVTRNMHRTYRFDVTALVQTRLQPLRVRFTSAHTEAERVRDQLGTAPNAYPETFSFIRKMAFSFG
jgi:beta-mannosidase